jgi:hypothetical protein
VSRLRVGIAVLVTVVWAAGYTISFVNHSFTAPPELSGIMLAVVTWLFGSEIKKKLTNGD